MKQASALPIRKVWTGVPGGTIVALLIVWGAKRFFDLAISPEEALVWSGIVTGVAIGLVQYFIPPAMTDTTALGN